MLPAIAIAMFLGSLLSHGRRVVDFSNDILNNVVSIAGDAHQAKVAQDIFRQEIRLERSLQMRDDIRDINKLMMESVSSTLFLGSIVLGTCFVSVIEGFPPLNSSRMVVAWWLFSAVWAINYNILAIWFALCFQLKISSSARERLLRRYRYRLPDDTVVARMGGQNLMNTMFRLNAMVVEQLGSLVWNQEQEEPQAPAERRPEGAELRVQVRSLDPTEALDCAPLRKGLHAWRHSSGRGQSLPKLLDVPFFLLGETLVRSRWHFAGERPLLLRVRGPATLYLAAQCPPLGGQKEHGGSSTLLGVRKAMGAEVPDWPPEELPVCTAGFHPAWRGPEGFGAFQRVEGYRLLVDANSIEAPLYKLVLAAPGPGGFVDVILCWRFREGCEGLLVMLRQGQVHCKEEDWPMAEFNDEVCQVQPLQYYSSFYLRRGIVCLVVNVAFAVLSKIWVLGERPMWWLEPALMAALMLPVLVTIYVMPISNSDTQEALSMPVVNRPSQAEAPPECGPSRPSKWDDPAGPSTDADACWDSPPLVPRRSSGRRHSPGAPEEAPREAERAPRGAGPGAPWEARAAGPGAPGPRGEGPLRVSVVDHDAPAGLLFTCGPCARAAPFARERLAGPEAYAPAGGGPPRPGPTVAERAVWTRLPDELPEEAAGEPLGNATRGAAAAVAGPAAAAAAAAGVAPGGAPRGPRLLRLCRAGLPACCARVFLGTPEEPGATPSVTAQRLYALTCLFDALFVVAVLIILASPIVDWGQVPISLGPEQIPGSDAG